MNITLLNILALSLKGSDVMSAFMVGMVVIAFFTTWAINRISILRIRHSVDQSHEVSAIMQHTLDMGNNYVLKLDVPRKQAYNLHRDLLPEEGMSFYDSLTYIHPDDRPIFRAFIMRLVNGEKAIDECVFRWDMSGKEKKEQWRYMRDKGIGEYSGSTKKTPTNIFCTLSDCTEEIEEEHAQQELTDRYRMIFEQSIVGLAFYDKEGNLTTANQRMREIMNFQSEKDPFYYENTLYDMPTFRDVINNRHIEELYFCTKSVIVERGVNCYTEMRVHPIYDENGELVYISLAIRDVTQERELYLKNKRNDVEIRQANAEIQQYEGELKYLMENSDMRFWRTSFKNRTITFYKELTRPEKTLTFDEYQKYFVDEEGIIARNFEHPEEHFKEPVAYLCHMRALYHESDELQWNILDNVPYFDENGNNVGCYGVIRNVTELIQKQELLKQETERANDSGRLKSVFMANMTHEIRTPLNSIVGFSDILPMLTTHEEKQEIIRVIMNNCDMLLRLINDILAISSLDAGGVRIEPQQVDFSKAFDDICESLSQRVQTPGVEFLRENPYPTFVTTIDNGRIQQVITNFVTNAVKYTQQGHIKVGYRYEDQGLYIYCEDTGTGIPKADQAKIFDRFVKLNDYIQGTGLGLSICKAIADGCNGRIGVTSEGEGHGSTFWLWVPCQEENNSERES